MPVNVKVEDGKMFFQYGKTGKKYYFITIKEMIRAYKLAQRQARAIEWRRHRS